MSTTSADIRDRLADLLRDELGIYNFEGVGSTPAISLLHKGEPVSPRQVQGLECVVIAIPQVTQKNYEFEAFLKFWNQGKNNYSVTLDLIKEEFPMSIINTLNVRENPELLAAIVIKIKYPILFDD